MEDEGPEVDYILCEKIEELQEFVISLPIVKELLDALEEGRVIDGLRSRGWRGQGRRRMRCGLGRDVRIGGGEDG